MVVLILHNKNYPENQPGSLGFSMNYHYFGYRKITITQYKIQSSITSWIFNFANSS